MSTKKSEKGSKLNEKDLIQFFYFLKEYEPKWKEIRKLLKEFRNNKDNTKFGNIPSVDSKDLFTFINDYYEQREKLPQDVAMAAEEGHSQPINADQDESILDDSPNEELIEDEKILNDPEAHMLSSMSRDGMRGPYGMDMTYRDKPTSKNYHSPDSKNSQENQKESLIQNVQVSPKERFNLRMKAKSSSSNSTPSKFNKFGGNYKQSTSIKRWRKRDSTFIRRGIEGMNPYCIIREESDDYQWANNGYSNNPADMKRDPSKTYSTLVAKWCRYEYFYSNLDKCYFSRNKFKEILEDLQIEQEVCLNKLEWIILRKAIDKALNPHTGKKRRFSDALIKEERSHLARFREIYREIMKILSKNKNNFKNIEKLVCHQYLMDKEEDINEEEVRIVLNQIKKFNTTPLEVGQRFKVLALHPRTGTLNTGTILTSNIVSAHIQFDREDLGVWLVKDYNMVSFKKIQKANGNGQLNANDIRSIQFNSAMKSLLKNEQIQSLIPASASENGEPNVKSMAMMTLLLQRKTRILDELQRMNEILESNPSANEHEEFKQKYAWVSLQLLVTNAIIEPVLSRFTS
ncbi:unnamed protein product [Moneuplotes crassus]|uniref:DIRP domain-containing protein n=2 Tax=Euplotes crassus TaxID=5936 RepID=A0AAD1U9C7_EUPCR|nr:unnamed protein product [Moneuplotes crassus]